MIRTSCFILGKRRSPTESKATDRDDHDLLITRLREAASKVTEWSTGSDQTGNVRNKEVLNNKNLRKLTSEILIISGDSRRDGCNVSN